MIPNSLQDACLTNGSQLCDGFCSITGIFVCSTVSPDHRQLQCADTDISFAKHSPSVTGRLCVAFVRISSVHSKRSNQIARFESVRNVRNVCICAKRLYHFKMYKTFESVQIVRNVFITSKRTKRSSLLKMLNFFPSFQNVRNTRINTKLSQRSCLLETYETHETFEPLNTIECKTF